MKELRKAVEKEIDDYINKNIDAINKNDEILKHWSTDKKWDLFQKGEITREKAIEIATKRIERKYHKYLDEKIEKINEVQSTEEAKEICIYISYVKNRSYGNYSVFAEVVCGSRVYKGNASGGGYDKESAAMADALNECNSILKALYNAKNEALKENCDVSSCESLGYGSGYGAVPYFESGVGDDCLMRIFKKIGYHVHVNYNRNGNTYIISKGDQ